MAIGAFATVIGNVLRSPNVIYTSTPKIPVVSSTPPSYRMPTTTSSGGGLTVPTAVYPVNVDPDGTGGAQPVSTFGGTTTSGGTATGFVPSTTTGGTTPTAEPPPTATGSATGNQTGSTGSTDTSRLIDLISSAFRPQEIGQTYGPQSVSSDVMQPSGGTNPMAVVILAIVVIAGVFLYAHRKTNRAAA